MVRVPIPGGGHEACDRYKCSGCAASRVIYAGRCDWILPVESERQRHRQFLCRCERGSRRCEHNFFNPAGLTRLSGRQLVVSGNLVNSSVKFSNAGSVAPALPPGGALGHSGGDAGGWALMPVTYLSWQFSPNFYAGIGFNTPFGLKTEYDGGWMGRFYALKSEAKSLNINPNLAFKVSEALSVGAGVSYQYFQNELTNAVNYAAVAAGGCAPQPACIGPAIAAVGAQTEGIAKLKGDDGAWGFNLGAMVNLGPDSRIGLAYRSSIKHKLTGTAAFSNRPGILAAAVPDGPITSELKLPAYFSLGLAHQINPRWQLVADLGWTQWSTFQTVNVVRADSGALLSSLNFRWRDTWRIGIGLNYRVNEPWTLRFGTVYEQTPTNNVDREPRLPDPNRFWLAAGAQYRLNKQEAIDIGYVGSVRTTGINQTLPNIPASTAAASGQLMGNVDNNVHIIAIQYRRNF